MGLEQQWTNAANTLVALVTTYGLARCRRRDHHPGRRLDVVSRLYNAMRACWRAPSASTAPSRCSLANAVRHLVLV